MRSPHPRRTPTALPPPSTPPLLCKTQLATRKASNTIGKQSRQALRWLVALARGHGFHPANPSGEEPTTPSFAQFSDFSQKSQKIWIFMGMHTIQ